MGILEVIAGVLVVLKLLGEIDITWLEAFSPLLVACFLYVVIFIAYKMAKPKKKDWFFRNGW